MFQTIKNLRFLFLVNFLCEQSENVNCTHLVTFLGEFYVLNNRDNVLQIIKMKNVRYEKREFVRNNTTKKIVEMEWAQNFYHLLLFLEWKTQQWHSQNNKVQNTLHKDNMKRGNRCGMIIRQKILIVTFRLISYLIPLHSCIKYLDLECPKLSNIIGSAHYQCKIQRVEFSLYVSMRKSG